MSITFHTRVCPNFGFRTRRIKAHACASVRIELLTNLANSRDPAHLALLHCFGFESGHRK